MSKSPAFQFYPADWLSDPKVMMMTPAQEGAYIRLICVSWQNGDGSLPNDDAKLAKLSRLGRNWQRSADIIKSCFELIADRLYHPKLLSELKKQESFRETQRNNVKKRWNSQSVDSQSQKNTTVQNGTYQTDTDLYPSSSTLSSTLSLDNIPTNVGNANSENQEPKTEKKEERKKVAPKKKEEPATPHWQPCVATWFEFYERNYRSRPTFDPISQAKLKALLGNLQSRCEGEGTEWTQQMATDSLTKFLQLAMADKWLAQNFMLKNLHSQFDKIYATHGQPATKNGTAGTNGKPTAASVIAHFQKSYNTSGGE
jgi:uncharacterized protein YdaU (DUF1376 family)